MCITSGGQLKKQLYGGPFALKEAASLFCMHYDYLNTTVFVIAYNTPHSSKVTRRNYIFSNPDPPSTPPRRKREGGGW